MTPEEWSAVRLSLLVAVTATIALAWQAGFEATDARDFAAHEHAVAGNRLRLARRHDIAVLWLPSTMK